MRRNAPKKYLQLRLLQVRALNEVPEEESDDEWYGQVVERVNTPPIRPFKSRRLAGQHDNMSGTLANPSRVFESVRY